MVVQNTLVGMFKQMFTRRNEQVMCKTFWANDWKRGLDYVIDGRTYRVTRYVRCSDPRFFDVMGYEVQPATMFAAASAIA